MLPFSNVYHFRSRAAALHAFLLRFFFNNALLYAVAATGFCVIGSTGAQAQIITTIAGTGISGFSGDGGPAIGAQFGGGGYIICDSAGRIYIGDHINNRVRVIDTDHIIRTIAGTGTPGFSGDGFPATAAELNRNFGIALDTSGNLYITEIGNNRIRMINAAGIITTVAGTGVPAYSGDGGPATAADLSILSGIITDLYGNTYFVNHRNIRKIDASGIVTTVAGNNTFGFSGDGGPATAAQLNLAGSSLATDAPGNLYFADRWSHRIRKVDGAGIITTIAGSGTTGTSGGSFSGDGGPATTATLRDPSSIAFDKTTGGNLYILDRLNHRVRKVDAGGIITTVAGTGTAGYAGDGGPATAAQINNGYITMDCAGNLFINDSNRIRMITFGHAPSFIGVHTQSLTICKNATAVPVNAFLAVAAADSGRQETWSMASAPAHGTATGSYTTIATGGTLMPTGLSYTPAPGFTGSDTFKIQVSDCGYVKDTVTFYVTVADCELDIPRSGPAEQVAIWPNPANDLLTIAADKGSVTSLSITNSAGVVFIQQQITTAQTKVNIKMLPPGVYYVTVGSKQGAVVKQFVKIE